MANPKKVLKTETKVKKADKDGKYVAALMGTGYSVGDFLIVDTAVDKYVGFFVGIKRDKILRAGLASRWKNFNDPKNVEVFDNILFVDCRLIRNVKAAPVSSNEYIYKHSPVNRS